MPPKYNIPGGVTGYFIPITDGAWSFLPAASWVAAPIRVSQGVYRRDSNKVAGTEYAILNLSKALESALGSGGGGGGGSSINAPEGALYGAGLLTSFDVVHAVTGANLTSVNLAIVETQYLDGAVPTIKNGGNTPALVCSQPVANSVSGSLTTPWIRNSRLSDAWLIGSGGPNNVDFLEITVVDPGTTPVFSLWGVQLYFSGQ
jgi:hypothetical protein